MVTLNSNSTLVSGSDGQLRFSGLTSGIDSQATIDAIMDARRLPAVQIENKITTNNQKITDFAEFKALATTFTDVLDELRAPNNFSSTDVFKTKLGFLTTANTVDPDTLVGTSIAETATTGTHTLTVQQIAVAHQVRSDAFTSTTTDVTTLGVTAGTFDLGTAAGVETVTIAVGDTLLDVRDKINTADNGVNATIVSADATTNYLVLTAEDTGVDEKIVITGGGNAISDSFGLTTASNFKNTLQTELDSIVDVDGITGITRASNTIDDIIQGVTLSLFQADAGTEVTLSVENDLNSIKTKIGEFVEAYNGIRAFIDDQRTEKARTEGDDTETFGSLAFDSAIRTAVDRMANLVTSTIPGQADGYEGLSQIGITLEEDFTLALDDATFDNKLLTNTNEVRSLFVFDFSSNDSRVTHVSHTDETTGLVDVNGDPVPYYLNIDGTDASSNVTAANLQVAAASGSGDGSVSVANTVLTATDVTTAEGLVLNFNGAVSLGAISDIEVTFTRGIADQLYYYFEEITQTSGTLDAQVTNLTGQNEEYEEDIVTIDSRLATVRSSLETKFVAMELALAQLESLKATISSYFDAQDSE